MSGIADRRKKLEQPPRHADEKLPEIASPPGDEEAARAAPAAWAVVAVLAGIAAAWIAAGSVGLLAISLRHAINLILLATILLAGVAT